MAEREKKLAAMASRSLNVDKLQADLDAILKENEYLEQQLQDNWTYNPSPESIFSTEGAFVLYLVVIIFEFETLNSDTKVVFIMKFEKQKLQLWPSLFPLSGFFSFY